MPCCLWLIGQFGCATIIETSSEPDKIDIFFNDSVKFQNCLELCNITQNVHTATHLHGYILYLVLTPIDTSGISYVRVAKFISDHALVFLAQLGLVKPPSQMTNVVTFRTYHKTDSLHKYLGNCSFVRCPDNTANVLCEQYLDDLSKLFDKLAPLVTHSFTKQAAGWLSDSYRLAKAVRWQLERIWYKDKAVYNRARFCIQIAWSNSLANKNKAKFI